MSDVVAPAANLWDVVAVKAAARAILRANPGDDDDDWLGQCVATATTLIDQDLDRLPVDADADPPVDVFDAGAIPYLFDAAVQLTVELVQRKDQAPLVDPVETVRAQIRPAKSRWGIA